MSEEPKVKIVKGGSEDNKLIFRDASSGKDIVCTTTSVSVGESFYHQNTLTPVRLRSSGNLVVSSNDGMSVQQASILTSDHLIAGRGIKVIKNDNGTVEVTLDDPIQQVKEGKIELHDLGVVLHSDNPMRALLEIDPESMFRTKSDEVLSWKTVREIIVAMFDRLSTPSKAKKRSKVEL